MTASGIYAICRKDSDECYIGSAVDVAKRWRLHRRDLCKGTHHSRFMQRVHDKHGADAFEFAIMEPVADKAKLIEREQVWLDRFNPAYNTATVAGSCLGVKHTDATRAKISAYHTGRTHSAETRAKMSRAAKGMSAEHRQRLSAAGKARPPFSAETCAKLSTAAKARPPFSAEHRARISAAMSGKKRQPPSAEVRRRLSVANIGRRPSDEARERMSMAGRARVARERIHIVSTWGTTA